MNKITPIPCKKFKHASINEWLDKLHEEVSEVEELAQVPPFRHDTEEELTMELMDVITVCYSWLYALGYEGEKLNVLTNKVNEKNRVRGYHDENTN